MRRWSAGILSLLFLGLVACAEVSVKEVQKCSKVVKAELKSYSYLLGLYGPHITLTLEDGTKKRLILKGYQESLKIEDGRVYKYVLDTAPSLPFMLRVKLREMGREYCRTEYEWVR